MQGPRPSNGTCMLSIGFLYASFSGMCGPSKTAAAASSGAGGSQVTSTGQAGATITTIIRPRAQE